MALGGKGAGGIIKLPLLMPCKLPAILAPPLCKWRRLEFKPKRGKLLKKVRNKLLRIYKKKLKKRFILINILKKRF